MSDGQPDAIVPVIITVLIVACVIVLCIRCCRRNQTVGYMAIIEQPAAQEITINVAHPIQQGIPQSQYQPHMYPTQQYPNQYAPDLNTYGGQQHYQTGVQAGMMQHDGNPGNPGMQPSPQPPCNPAWTPSPYGQQSRSDLPPPYEGVSNPNAPKSHNFK